MTKKTKKTGPDPVLNPNKLQDDQIAALWFRPNKYVNGYVVEAASKIMKKPITLNHLNRGYKGRANPDNHPLPKDHGGLIKALQA